MSDNPLPTSPWFWRGLTFHLTDEDRREIIAELSGQLLLNAPDMIEPDDVGQCPECEERLPLGAPTRKKDGQTVNVCWGCALELDELDAIQGVLDPLAACAECGKDNPMSTMQAVERPSGTRHLCPPCHAGVVIEAMCRDLGECVA